MRKKIWITYLFLMFGILVSAQDERHPDAGSSNTETVTSSDTVYSVVETKKAFDDEQAPDTGLVFHELPFSPDSIRAWKELRAFSYAKYLDSLLKEKQKKKQAQRPVNNGPSWLDSLLASPVTRVLLWIMAGVFILFILYRLFLAQGVFRRNAGKNEEAGPAVTEEQISVSSDLDAMIRQAVAAGNLRLAIRYHYLQTLHRLAEKQYLQLAADKTNYQYVSEIAREDIQKEFAALTLGYEYAWYGEFEINEPIYRKLETGFTQLNQKI